MRKLGAIALVLLAGLAGCLGDAGTDGLDEAGTEADVGNATADEVETPVPMALSMDGCAEQLGIFPVAAPPGMAPLPEGFESENLLYVFATTCGSAPAAGDGPVTQMHGGLFVSPPDGYANDEAVGHAFPLGTLASDANVTAVFDAWNLGQVEETDVTVEILEQNDLGRTGHVLGETEGTTIHMYSQAMSPMDGDPGVVRFFGVQDGEVTNAVDMTWTEASALQGEANLVLEGTPSVPPFPVPAEPGLVEHWWGDDYDFDFTYVPLNGTGGS